MFSDQISKKNSLNIQSEVPRQNSKHISDQYRPNSNQIQTAETPSKADLGKTHTNLKPTDKTTTSNQNSSFRPTTKSNIACPTRTTPPEQSSDQYVDNQEQTRPTLRSKLGPRLPNKLLQHEVTQIRQ